MAGSVIFRLDSARFGSVWIMSIGKSRLGSVCYVEMRSGLYGEVG